MFKKNDERSLISRIYMLSVRMSHENIFVKMSRIRKKKFISSRANQSNLFISFEAQKNMRVSLM
jgi:hypothetical protein